jgi:uracil-DNA glycosylase family 4
VQLPHPRIGTSFESPVPPGTGWPGDPAASDTPVAATAGQVRRLAAKAGSIDELDAMVSVCRACPRLVAWREEVAAAKRRSYSAEPYWGRPIPGWGASAPRIMVVGLAPAAHGGNRTGRVFTGDRSGDFLFSALHRAGLASQPDCTDAADGLVLNDTRVAAAVRCAPPANKPTPAERTTCTPWLDAEWRMAGADVRVVVALGGFAWQVVLQMLRDGGGTVVAPAPKFGHGAEATAEAGGRTVTVIGCYHPSQQNTFTGRLTPQMLDDVFARAVELARERTGNRKR